MTLLGNNLGKLTDVHDTAVNVAKLLEAKESGALGRVIEDIALKILLVNNSWLKVLRGNIQSWHRLVHLENE